VNDQGDETFDQGGVGVVAQVQAAVAELRPQPHGGDAAGHAVGVGAVVGGQGGQVAHALDDDGEAFLGVFDEGELAVEATLLFGDGGRHAAQPARRGAAGQNSTSRQRVSSWRTMRARRCSPRLATGAASSIWARIWLGLLTRMSRWW